MRDDQVPINGAEGWLKYSVDGAWCSVRVYPPRWGWVLRTRKADISNMHSRVLVDSD